MNTKYKDLIEQTFDFPQEEFQVENGNLLFHDIELVQLIEQYGTPLKFNYLPKIFKKINRAKSWFEAAIKIRSIKGNTIMRTVLKALILNTF